MHDPTTATDGEQHPTATDEEHPDKHPAALIGAAPHGKTTKNTIKKGILQSGVIKIGENEKKRKKFYLYINNAQNTEKKRKKERK